MDILTFTQWEHQCDVYNEWFEHAVDMGKWTIWSQAPYEILQMLFKWHFDVFSLINSGLAIKHHSSKLTEDDIREMKSMKFFFDMSNKEISEYYPQISYSNLCKILKGKIWKHV